MPRLILVVAALTVLALPGCARLAESRINPLNWFRGPAVATAADPALLRPLVPAGWRTPAGDPRSLIGAVASVSLDRTADAWILTATGQSSNQGWFNAALVPVPAEDGVLTFEFRAEDGGGAGGTAASRTLTAAVMLDDAEVAGARAIRVLGATNAQTLSR